MKSKKYEHIIEGILFLSGNEGVSTSELLLTLNIDQMTIEDTICKLKKKYEQDSGLELLYTNNTYKLVTKSEYYEYFKDYASLDENNKLGNSALETLAIIAYNQPITKYTIENLKGVTIQHNLQVLINKNLVYVSGRSEEIGRPNLYSTTDKFLDYIGINSLEELPDLKSFALNEESTKLLNFEDFDFKELSNKLLNNENTIKIEKIDDKTLQELNDIDTIDIDLVLDNNDIEEHIEEIEEN